MEILAKAAPLKEQIEDKINKGCNGIELQLLSDFLDDKYDAKHFYDKISSINNLDIKVVHLPIIQGQDLNLELFS